MSNISLADVGAILVAIPPTAEQQRIVAEVQRLESVMDQLDHSIQQQSLRIGSLRQSVLRAAFEGKLVDQDSADEPGGALLERIRKAREAATEGARDVRGSGRRRVPA